MKRIGFYLKLLLIIILITDTQAVGIETLFYFIMNPTLEELYRMATIPAVPVVIINLAYIILAFWLAAPLPAYYRDLEVGAEISPERKKWIRQRAINLPYYLAAMSFTFFVFGATVITWTSLKKLGWPGHYLGYGVLGGIISGLLAVPLYIYLGGWLTKSVIDRTLEDASISDSAIYMGRRISLRLKITMIMFSTVVAACGYTSIIGYAQTTTMYENLQRMQTLLPDTDAVQEQIVTKPTGAADPRIRSAEFFADRLGSLRGFYLALMLISTGVALVLALLASRQIIRPIRALVHVAERVRHGYYGEPVRMASNDELAVLAVALNNMMVTITDQIGNSEYILSRLDEGVRRVDETMHNMLAISTSQTEGATEQAASIHQATSITEEIVATAREIANRAKMVEEVAKSTQEASQEGEDKLAEARHRFEGIVDQVEAFQSSMIELEDRFQEIYKIVEWMEDLAEQSELLALNAALEAAGAGEEGKRFSVVAQATRRLAQRSADATREIRELVEKIQKASLESAKVAEGGRERVTLGGQAVDEAVQSLQTISTFARATAQSVSEISLSTAEQSDASEQLATSFSNIQLIASKVEDGAAETKKTAEELRRFAEMLKETLGAK